MSDFILDPTDGLVLSKRPNGRKRVVTMNKSESRTVQSDRERSEMKAILRRYEAFNVVDHLSSVDLQFRDVSEFSDMSDALRQLRDAEHVFMRLDPRIRDVFDNDAARWLDAGHDGLSAEQIEQLRGLGIPGLEAAPVAPAPPGAPPTPSNED